MVDRASSMGKEIKEFLAYLGRRGYSPHTIKNYEVDLKLFFEAVKRRKIQVSRGDVERFMEDQQKKKLSPNTISRRLFAIKGFLDFVIDKKGMSLENPIGKRTFPRRRKPLPKACRDEDIHKLFGVISDPFDKAMFILMLRCGLRVSEVSNLMIDDIDFSSRTLFIRQGKGGKDRSVYMSDDSVFILKRCLKERGKDVKTEYFFFNKKDKARGVGSNAIQKKLERYCREASIKMSCHQLRHTFAKGLLEEGTGIMTIKNLLGHESVMTSERYAKLSDEKVKRDYFKAMERIIKENLI